MLKTHVDAAANRSFAEFEGRLVRAAAACGGGEDLDVGILSKKEFSEVVDFWMCAKGEDVLNDFLWKR